MRKQEFLSELKARLVGLPKDDIEERLVFYSEMIDDRIEEGLTEEEAVSEIGTVDEVIAHIVEETPLTKLVKEKMNPKRALKAWEIVLLVLGAPLWVSLLLAVAVVFFAAYVVLWSLIVCLWAAEVSFAACSVMEIMSFFVFLIRGEIPAGLAILGAGIAFFGLAILLFFGCIESTKGILRLTKKLTFGIKTLFVGKENVK